MEDAGWELRWPPNLLASEARWLLRPAVVRLSGWRDRVEYLLEEAFVGPEARDAFSRTRSEGYGYAAFSDDPEDLEGPEFVTEVADAAYRFRAARAPRPYWPERRSGTLRAEPNIRRQFVQLVNDLRGRGYLDEELPWGCVDDSTPSVDPSPVLEGHLGVPDLWPLEEGVDRWDDDTFYGLIEVIHDLVSRPRHRWYHSYNDCGWHWDEFARTLGQTLYRWRVNRLLERGHVELRLADEGEDLGRLVATTDPARAELASTMAQRTDPTGEQVRHALMLFRRRGSTKQDKRSAIIALYGVLEERRDLLREHLYAKDEDVLFQIANKFAVRHQTASQHADYDPVFLDWVFWWYLATIELTDRLLARQSPKRPS